MLPVVIARIVLVFLLAGFFITDAAAQRLDADSLFMEARTLAFSGKREQARAICQTILSQKPDYHDVRILMARTYAWDRQYKEARDELKKVLEKKPSMHDAISANIDNEFWAGNYLDAVAESDKGLNYFPGDPDFLIKKARALEKLELYEEALEALDKVVNPQEQVVEGGVTSGDDPSVNRQPDETALAMIERIKLAMIKNAAGINYALDVFSEIYDPRHLVFAEAKRRTKIGTVIGRVAWASRFERTGWQYEVDAYPKITAGMYAYLNFGVSSSPLFPEYRIGAELHKKLKRGFEASLGVRYLAFTQRSIAIYTGSIGKYYKDYWFSLRPFITPKGNGVSNSFMLLVRRYLKNADNFLTLQLGTGFTPENNNNFSAETYLLHSQKAGLDYNCLFAKRFAFKTGFMLERQELSFRPGDYIFAYNYEIGLAYRF